MSDYWAEAMEENRRRHRLAGRSFRFEFLHFMDEKYGPFADGNELLLRAEEYADEKQAMEDVEPPELSSGPVYI